MPIQYDKICKYMPAIDHVQDDALAPLGLADWVSMTTIPSINPRFSVAADVLTQRIGDETVFLQLTSEGYYTLDDVGTCMLTALLATQDMELAFAQIASEYAVDALQVNADFVQIFDDLVAAGILKVEA